MPLGNGGEPMGPSEERGRLADRMGPAGGRPFLHCDEKGSPGNYRVQFSDDHSVAEVTASGRTGLFRLTFPAHVIPRVFVGGMGEITRTSRRSLQGAAFPVVLRYDRDDNGEDPSKDGVILRFAPSAEGATVIVLRISVSTVSPESAEKNIDAETGGVGVEPRREKEVREEVKAVSVVGV